MAKYRYTWVDAATPLVCCPSCSNNLTGFNAVRVEMSNGQTSATYDVLTRLHDDGVLDDVTGDVEMGHHSATYCRSCDGMLIDMEGVNEWNLSEDEDEETDPEVVAMDFADEVEGRIELVRHGWGADLLVDGKQVAFIDLFPKNSSRPAQVIVDGGPGEEPLAKLLLVPDGLQLVVHRNARMSADELPDAIHHGGDYLFLTEPAATDEE